MKCDGSWEALIDRWSRRNFIAGDRVGFSPRRDHRFIDGPYANKFAGDRLFIDGPDVSVAFHATEARFITEVEPLPDLFSMAFFDDLIMQSMMITVVKTGIPRFIEGAVAFFAFRGSPRRLTPEVESLPKGVNPTRRKLGKSHRKWL